MKTHTLILAALLLAPLAALLAAAPAAVEPANRTLVFHYASPYVDRGQLMDGPITVSLCQVTDLAPVSDLCDGVVLMFPWAQLEPEQGKYHFDVIDHTLEFWKARGKKVILNIASAGWLFELGSDLGGKDHQLYGWTPDWVMKTCETHIYDSRLLYSTGEKRGPVRAATFWDPKFYEPYFAFIAALGKRYDGDSRLACVRVGTGMVGEDQPLIGTPAEPPAPDSLVARMKGPYLRLCAGYTHRRWYDYMRRDIEAHALAFPRSQLEVDLSWSGWPWKDETNGGRAEVMAVLDMMQKHHAILGFNGWRSLPPEELATEYRTEMWNILKLYRERGLPVALEGGALAGTHSRDTAIMLDWCRKLRPAHVDFFGQLPAVLNAAQDKAGVNDGPSLANFFRMGAAAAGDPRKLAKDYLALVQSIR